VEEGYRQGIDTSLADTETLNLHNTAGLASDELEDSVAATSDAEAGPRAPSKPDKEDQWEDKEALYEAKMSLQEEEEHHRTEDSNLKDGNLGMRGRILAAISELVHTKIMGSSLPILDCQDYNLVCMAISRFSSSLVSIACRRKSSTHFERVAPFLLSAPRWWQLMREPPRHLRLLLVYYSPFQQQEMAC
jgi:hypothetical protein